MKIALLIVGVVGILIGLAITGVSVGLHLANPRNIRFEEALPGIAGGCCCSSLSFVIALGGLVWMLVATKESRSQESAD